MTTKELIRALQELEAPDNNVLMSQDSEGNLYHSPYEVVFENSFVVIYPNDSAYQMDEDGNFESL